MVFYKVFVIVSSSLWWIQGYENTNSNFKILKVMKSTSKTIQSYMVLFEKWSSMDYMAPTKWSGFQQFIMSRWENTSNHLGPWQDYGGIEWKQTLKDLEEAPDVVYQDVLNELDSMWGVKNLIVTRRNLVVNWMDRPHMRAHYLLIPLELRWLARVGWIFGYLCNWFSQFVPKT